MIWELVTVEQPVDNDAVPLDVIFEHIADPRMEFVQNVFSDSAFGDDTSTFKNKIKQN